MTIKTTIYTYVRKNQKTCRKMREESVEVLLNIGFSTETLSMIQ